MFKMNKMVSAIVLVCFLFNTIVSDLAFGQVVNYKSGDKLAVPLASDDIVGIQHKDMALIKIGVEARVMPLIKRGLSRGVDATNPGIVGSYLQNFQHYKENTIFNPVDMQFFFHEMKSTKYGFSVMVRLTDKKYSGPRTYYATFHLKEDKDGGVPVNVYTEEQYKATNELSKGVAPIKAEDEKAITRYIENNEKIIDPWLEAKMKAGQYAVCEKDKGPLYDNALLYYSYWAKEVLLNELRWRILPPLEANKINMKYKDEMFQAFLDRKLVFILAEDSEVPEIEEKTVDGKVAKIKVFAHSSNNATYVIFNKKQWEGFNVFATREDSCVANYVDSSFLRRFTITGINEIGALGSLSYSIEQVNNDYGFEGEYMPVNILDRLVFFNYPTHYGLTLTKDLDNLRKDRYLAGRPNYAPQLKSPYVPDEKALAALQNMKPVNLDFLRGEDGKSSRDYAGGVATPRGKQYRYTDLSGFTLFDYETSTGEKIIIRAIGVSFMHFFLNENLRIMAFTEAKDGLTVTEIPMPAIATCVVDKIRELVGDGKEALDIYGSDSGTVINYFGNRLALIDSTKKGQITIKGAFGEKIFKESDTRSGKNPSDSSDLMLPSDGSMTGIDDFSIGKFIETFVPKDEQEAITAEVLSVLSNSMKTNEGALTGNSLKQHLLNLKFNEFIVKSSSHDEANKFKAEAGYQLRKILINPIVARGEPYVVDASEVSESITNEIELYARYPDMAPLFEFLHYAVNMPLDTFYIELLKKIRPEIILVEKADKEYWIKFMQDKFKKCIFDLFASGSVTIVDYEKALKGTPVLNSPALNDKCKKPFLGKLGFTSGNIRIMGTPKGMEKVPELQDESQRALAEEVIIYFMHTRALGAFSHDDINALSGVLVDEVGKCKVDHRMKIADFEKLIMRIRCAISKPMALNMITDEKPMDLLLPAGKSKPSSKKVINGEDKVSIDEMILIAHTLAWIWGNRERTDPNLKWLEEHFNGKDKAVANYLNNFQQNPYAMFVKLYGDKYADTRFDIGSNDELKKRIDRTIRTNDIYREIMWRWYGRTSRYGYADPKRLGELAAKLEAIKSERSAEQNNASPGPSTSLRAGKSPLDTLNLICRYLEELPDNVFISAPAVLELYTNHYTDMNFEAPAKSALRTIERDLFEADNSLEKQGYIERLPENGENGAFQFIFSAKGRYYYADKAHERKSAKNEETVAEGQEIIDMTSLALEAGRQIPTHPVKDQFTLFVDNTMYKDKERDNDTKIGYMAGEKRVVAGDRFKLEVVDTSNVANILRHLEGKDPAKVIVQISNELSKSAINELKAKAPGIRILRIDTKDFKDDKNLNDTERQKCRFDLYGMMLEARKITQEDVDTNSSAYRTLEFFIRTHNIEAEGGLTATDYIQAIVSDDFAKIIKANLSYRPVEQYKAPEYNNVAASLISA